MAVIGRHVPDDGWGMTEGIGGRPGVRSRATLLALASCGITVSLMHTLVVPVLPTFQKALDATSAEVSWLVTVTMLAGAVCAPVLGRLGDMFGKRRVLLFALATMVAGSVLGALSWGLEPLIVARGMQGMAFGVVPIGISILKDELPEHRSGSGVAIMSSTLGVGGAIGLPLSGVISQFAGWHALFWLAAAMSVVGLLMALAFVPESPIRSGGRFDFVGAVVLGVALASLLLAIAQGGEWGWGSPLTLGMLAAGVGLVPLWAVYELRVSNPLVNLRISTQPVVLLTNLAAILIGVAMFTSFVLTGQVLQAPEATGYGFGFSAMAAGLCLVPNGVCMVVFSPLSAKLSARRGPHVTLVAGGIVLAAANLLQALLLPSVTVIVIAVGIVSIGAALAFSAMPMLIMNVVPRTETAAANSLNALMRTIGTSSASAVTAALLVALTVQVDGETYAAGTAFRTAFGIATVCGAGATILAGVVAFRLRGTTVPADELEAELAAGAPPSTVAVDVAAGGITPAVLAPDLAAELAAEQATAHTPEPAPGRAAGHAHGRITHRAPARAGEAGPGTAHGPDVELSPTP